MPAYELAIIMTADLTESNVKEKLDDLKKIITAGNGEISRTENWGLRSLAYRIGKHRRGIYNLINFGLPAEKLTIVLPTLGEKLKLDESVIRHMLIRIKNLPTEASIMLQPEPAAPTEEEKEPENNRNKRRERRGPSSWRPGEAADDVRSTLSERPVLKEGRDRDANRNKASAPADSKAGKESSKTVGASKDGESTPAVAAKADNDSKTGDNPDTQQKTEPSKPVSETRQPSDDKE